MSYSEGLLTRPSGLSLGQSAAVSPGGAASQACHSHSLLSTWEGGLRPRGSRSPEDSTLLVMVTEGQIFSLWPLRGVHQE